MVLLCALKEGSALGHGGPFYVTQNQTALENFYLDIIGTYELKRLDLDIEESNQDKTQNEIKLQYCDSFVFHPELQKLRCTHWMIFKESISITRVQGSPQRTVHLLVNKHYVAL